MPVLRSIAAVFVVGLVACGDPQGPSDPPPLLTALPRPLTPAEAGIATAANRFAFDLLATIQADTPDSTIFLSPLSATMALGMTMNGASGETFAEMRSALGFGPGTQAELNAGYRGLLDLLTGLDTRTELQVANAIWADPGVPFLPAFFEAGRTWFDAEVRNGAFSDPATLAAVNAWVREKTRTRIPKILDAFEADTRMVLLNAVYFKGRWREAFKPSATRPAEFRGVTGAASVPTMHLEATMRYAADPAYQAVELLYGNGGFAMTIVVPREGLSPRELEVARDAAAWAAMVGRLAEAKVNLALPRFRIEFKRDLDADLKAMGMVRAFDRERADFANLVAPPLQAWITKVTQKTFVEVNEEGTEAAAVTSVQVGVTSAPVVQQVRVDRPFLVAIRERFSGTILFLGQVTRIPAV